MSELTIAFDARSAVYFCIEDAAECLRDGETTDVAERLPTARHSCGSTYPSTRARILSDLPAILRLFACCNLRSSQTIRSTQLDGRGEAWQCTGRVPCASWSSLSRWRGSCIGLLAPYGACVTRYWELALVVRAATLSTDTHLLGWPQCTEGRNLAGV